MNQIQIDFQKQNNFQPLAKMFREKTRSQYQRNAYQQKQRKFHASIMSLSDKQKIKHSFRQLSAAKLTPEQKSFIRQNGTLIMTFIKDKMQMLNAIQVCANTQTIVKLYQNSELEQKIGQIQETIEFIQNEVLNKLSIVETSDMTSLKLNEMIYSILIQIQQLNLSLKSNIKNICSYNSQKSDNAAIITSRYASPKSDSLINKEKLQYSTNYISRVRSQQPEKVNQFQEFVAFQQNYAIRSDQQNIDLTSYQQNHSLNQQESRQGDTIVNYQNDSTFKQYFYSFLISYSATNDQYHGFLNSLFDELIFDQKYTSKQVQQAMMNDDQYCIKILTWSLQTKFKKLFTSQDKIIDQNALIYIPNRPDFLKLTLQFIKINLTQFTAKTKELCTKFNQISQILDKIHSFDTQTLHEQDLLKSKDCLLKYLPEDQNKISMRQFTFSSQALQNLKTNIIGSYNIKDNRHAFYAAINVFEKVILKISFDRISTCKRFNFEATQAIFQTIRTSNLLNNYLMAGFNDIYAFCQQTKSLEAKADELFDKVNANRIRKIISAWKRIPQRRQALLRKIIKRKTNVEKKQQNLIFNRWRLNISRQRISEKMLAHSQSCTTVLHKFTMQQIADFNVKTEKRRDSTIQNLKNVSEITVKRSNSSKNINPKDSNSISKTKVDLMKQETQQRRTEDLKLLNYRYKQQIVSRLSKQSKNLKDKTRLKV